jgi:hypothetical protein
MRIQALSVTGHRNRLYELAVDNLTPFCVYLKTRHFINVVKTGNLPTVARTVGSARSSHLLEVKLIFEKQIQSNLFLNNTSNINRLVEGQRSLSNLCVGIESKQCKQNKLHRANVLTSVVGLQTILGPRIHTFRDIYILGVQVFGQYFIQRTPWIRILLVKPVVAQIIKK